jgi:hypothetical protein
LYAILEASHFSSRSDHGPYHIVVIGAAFEPTNQPTNNEAEEAEQKSRRSTAVLKNPGDTEERITEAQS